MVSYSHARALVVLVISLTFSGLTHAQPYTGLYSFGDSLSDTGNVFDATGSPPFPYFDGNFSNGPVWADLLGPMLGLAATTASATGGTNYAWGGARTLVDNAVPSTQSQVTTYLADAGGSADSNALYTIWTGGNDINGVATGAATIPEVLAAASGIATIAGDLLTAGAQNILVLNVPNLGLTPLANGNEAVAEAFTTLFNDTLAAGLAGLGSPDVTLIDSFALLDAIVADPAGYGLTNVDDACFDGVATVCANPDEYLFWDGLHPTAKGHELIADAAFAAVIPVPAAAWLFGSALLGLVGLSRRRA